MPERKPEPVSWNCPLPVSPGDRIQMAHGGGGRMTLELIERLFLPAFRNASLEARHDGAIIEIGAARLALTTDSYVVRPLEFPGGTIGELAIYGTVNDLAMCGARPLFLSAGFILEEGFELQRLERIVAAMQQAARRARVEIVTGDTKVVEKGKGDGLFLNTAGIGLVECPSAPGPARVQPGDAVILNGDVGRHGIAILSVREGLEFDSPVESDLAPLWEPVEALLSAGIEVHCLRDLTRGGLAAALNEIARARGIAIELEEEAIPVSSPVQAACEILGLDPLYVANEGRFVAFVPGCEAQRALEILSELPDAPQPAVIGSVGGEGQPVVTLRSRLGTTRVLDLLSGEQLPRIC